MSTHYVIPTHGIVIVDSKRLRQAGIMHLLAAWAETTGLTLSAVLSDSPIGEHLNANCEMVILSIGASSVEDPLQEALIQSVRAHAPQAPLVILSDREEPREVCAAFELGAAGFMPTSIDPSIALQALAFIKSGGSFFPPSALSHTHRSELSALGECVVNGSRSAHHPSDKLRHLHSKLSAKQEEVFKRLCQGLSNKTIARQLGVSEATVKVHVRCVMRKFGVINRTQLAIAALGENTLTLQQGEMGTLKQSELQH
jgi:DNA-binding NarL/FixJ family response regulator